MLVQMVVARFEQIIVEGGTYSGRSDFRNAIAYKSADNEMTIIFHCGDTIKLKINEMIELCEALRDTDAQAGGDLEEIISYNR